MIDNRKSKHSILRDVGWIKQESNFKKACPEKPKTTKEPFNKKTSKALSFVDGEIYNENSILLGTKTFLRGANWPNLEYSHAIGI